MERAFSADFSAVRVHTGPESDRAASGLGASALTAGQDIVFRAGAFAPHTPGGDRLLAHELAHVVQQAGGLPRAAIDGGTADPLEKAAETAADQAVTSGRVAGLGPAPPVRGRDLRAAGPDRRSGHGRGSRVLAQLRPIPIASSWDPLEHEADRVANELTRRSARPSAAFETVTRKTAAATPAQRLAPASVHATLKEAGRPLGATTRAFFEPRLGVGLGAVRIHDDALARASAAEMSAHAYTVGSHIAFAGAYRDDNAAARTLLAHELVHVVQQSPGGRPLLQRAPSCRQLLGTGAQSGSRPAAGGVGERQVQEFLAAELRRFGGAVTVERELPIPAGSATPLRTEGRRGRGDTVIDPQILERGGKGWADIAMLVVPPELEILEVKEADWGSLWFAEWQLQNYVDKGNEAIDEVELAWRARGHPLDRIASLVPMPSTQYFPPDRGATIGGQRVALAWCGPGVIVFKSLDLSNKDVVYCGITDKGQTDAFLDSLLGRAEDAAARALRKYLWTQGEERVSLKPLLDKVREQLGDSIRRTLEEAFAAACAAAIEVSAAAVLTELAKLLRGQPGTLESWLETLIGRGPGMAPAKVPPTGPAVFAAAAIGFLLEYGVLAL